MFTQRSALLGFVAFCFYLVAVVNTLPAFYYALTWLSMAMLAASLGVALLSLIGLECQLELTRSRGAAALGEIDSGGALLAIAVSNVGTLNKTNIVLELQISDAKNGVQTLRFLLEAVPSGAALESVLPLLGLARGKYHLQSARLIGSDVLGLFRRQKMVELGEIGREIIIGPPILRSEVVPQGGASGYLRGNQRTLTARHGDELRGTRPYAPGDDLRHVHWKSSARAGELVVKEWEQTGQSSALVIWDGAAQTSWGQGDFNSTEWGLVLAASLCHAFLGSGTPCNFARLDLAPQWIENRALLGGELPPELTEALSGAIAERAAPFQDALQTLPRFTPSAGAKILVVSASLSSDLVNGVRALRGGGAQVQVFLIDGASLAARRGDGAGGSVPFKLFRPAQRSKNDGKIALSNANFQSQVAKLREVGALVTVVGAKASESAENSLRDALRGA